MITQFPYLSEQNSGHHAGLTLPALTMYTMWQNDVGKK
ncbi:hypothetical protein G52EAM_00489 [Candidatus Nanoperiomorbus periodonticus]|nr:hypothetical protein G52EAM_00489 [Candidatus Nanoperiomorbus periodonticus]